MTNAVDVLCVGGVRHQTVVCFNRDDGLAASHTFYGVGEADVVYDRVEWWHEDNQAWYHIATNVDDVPSDADIAITIAANLFPPAWDLRTKPAPEQPGEVA